MRRIQVGEQSERDALDIAAFHELRATGDVMLRERIINEHAWMAAHLAHRLAGRGEPIEDLVQVGQIGLIKAVDRFDPERGTPFGPYAFVTILGEIRRYFRDGSWRVKAPRRAKDLQAPLADAAEKLAQRLGRSPRPEELAGHLGVSIEDVLLALDARSANRTASLSTTTNTDEGQSRDMATPHGVAEDELVAIRSLLDRLPTREQEIVRLRFYEQLSQHEIAERVGVSQMHVSRLLRVALGTLKASIEAEE